MISRDNPGARSPRTPAYLMMGIFLVALWIAGGASRADAAGQIFAQGAAWLLLLGFVVWAPLPKLRPFAPIAFILLGCIALAAAQLVPLPPALWMSLPGRDLLAQTAVVTGQEQPWRPLSMSPGATANALASLIVPTLALVLAVSVLPEEKWRTATLLLCLVFASAILALLQFSGGNFDHPLINDVPGSVSGSFANRNHLALFIAIGCVLAPSWGFRGERSARWKGPVSIALLLFFGLIVLATGSRMGLLLGALGAAIGLMNVRRELRAVLRRQPRWLGIAVIAGVLVLAATAVLLSVTLGRAVSLERAFSLDVAEDLRRQALPTVWAMTLEYLPFGAGVGTFDPLYRMHEPTYLLDVRYFNHAHNDWLEWLLEGGVIAAALALAAVGWWLWKSFDAWRSSKPGASLARAGSGILLLTFAASVTDYPARTPMVAAVAVIAAVWLARGDSQRPSRNPPTPAATS